MNWQPRRLVYHANADRWQRRPGLGLIYLSREPALGVAGSAQAGGPFLLHCSTEQRASLPEKPAVYETPANDLEPPREKTERAPMATASAPPPDPDEAIVKASALTPDATAAAIDSDLPPLPPPEAPLGDELDPPDGLLASGRTWVQARPRLRDGAVGCASHIGSSAVIEDGKDNEDFAFATSCEDLDGATWLLCGVADGVSTAAWQRRGGQHASASFLAVMRRLLTSGIELTLNQELLTSIAQAYTTEVRTRLEQDTAHIVEQRLVSPNFRRNANFYLRYFLDDEDARGRRIARWFQTTLLAAALGPRGGIAITLGDGFFQLCHRTGAETRSRCLALSVEAAESSQRGSGVVISTELPVAVVLSAMHLLPAEDAEELAVILSTDGVSNTPRHGLESAQWKTSDNCRRYLLELGARPANAVEPDNLSVAFGRRRLLP